MIKLIATDMDGTFLKPDQTYDTKRFAAVHQRLQDAGIRFVVASGNQYYQLRSYFADYPQTIFVAENGAYIRSTETIYAVHSFKPEVVKQILAKLAAISEIKLLVCGQHSAYTLATTDPVHVANMRHYYHRLAVVPDYAQLNDNILKFAITCPPEHTQALVDQLTADLAGLAQPTSSGHGDIDLIQSGVHKAAGLAELGAQLGITLDEMAAFGDGGNDLEMLQEVGLGVAMANALPPVAAVADAHCASNVDSGVLAYLEQLLEDRK